MRKHYWKRCYEYRRILEILKEYWLTEPDEKEVVVTMSFEKANGEKQEKRIVWKNTELCQTEQ